MNGRIVILPFVEIFGVLFGRTTFDCGPNVSLIWCKLIFDSGGSERQTWHFMRWQPAAPIGQISSPWDGHLIHEEFSLTFEQVFFRNASGVSSYSFSITLLNSGIIRSPSSFKSKRTEAKINLI